MDFLTGPFENANWLQAAVAAVSSFVIGFIWYHKAVFGKIWMADTGMTEEKARQGNMPLSFGLSFVVMLVTAVYLSQWAGAGAEMAIKMALQIGIFFVITFKATHYLFNQKSFRLWLIDSLYDLVVLAVMGLIIGVWKP